MKADRISFPSRARMHRRRKKMLTKETRGKHKVSFYRGKTTLSLASSVQGHGMNRVRTTV